MSPKPTEGADPVDFVRLHITPFDAHLLKVVVPNAVLPLARNISYHQLEVFPEKRFGFVDLPTAEADKVRKKLNGATLRGVKMKIEKARAEDWIGREEDARKVEKNERKKAKRKSKAETEEEGFAPKKKRKREHDVVDGVMLKDRKVKRGWTETPAEAREKKKTKKDKASREDTKKGKVRTKSKHTDGRECLLKVTLPPDAVHNLSPDAADKLKKRKKMRGKEREVTVHEFENMSGFPSFLKGTTVKGGHTSVGYVEDKGWVNEKGDVVEAVKGSKRPPVKESIKPEKQRAVAKEPGKDDDDTSSSGTSSSGSDESSEEESEEETLHPKRSNATENRTENLSDSDPSDSRAEEIKSKSTPRKTARPSSSSSSKPLSITIPPPSTPAAVHPLEALYKRKPSPKDDAESAASPRASNAEPFSFFGGGNDSDLEHEETPNPGRLNVPMTPYTKQDFEWRNVRSAAPTPDTAHPSRMKNFWAETSPEDDAFAPISEYQQDEEAEEDEEEDVDEDQGGDEAENHGSRAGNEVDGTSSGATPSSDFQTWFWENRRELNRTWMQRRKTAAKEKRHRDNKARASRAV